MKIHFFILLAAAIILTVIENIKYFYKDITIVKGLKRWNFNLAIFIIWFILSISIIGEFIKQFQNTYSLLIPEYLDNVYEMFSYENLEKLYEQFMESRMIREISTVHKFIRELNRAYIGIGYLIFSISYLTRGLRGKICENGIYTDRGYFEFNRIKECNWEKKENKNKIYYDLSFIVDKKKLSKFFSNTEETVIRIKNKDKEKVLQILKNVEGLKNYNID